MASKKTIGELAKSETFWGFGGALSKAFRRWVTDVFSDERRPGANSMLASVCYTIANNYGGRGTRSGKALGGILLANAYFLSWLVEREIGLSAMTSGQLSVWVNIRYTWGLFVNTRVHKRAMAGILVALSRGNEIPFNDRALLLIKKGLMYDLWDESGKAKKAYTEALAIVDDRAPHAEHVSALDRVRVWRDYGESRLNHRNQTLEAYTFFTKARRLAVENNLMDQITKIDNLMRRYNVPLDLDNS